MVTTKTAWEVVAAVADPEIPVLNIAELGILRAVDVTDDGVVSVTVTPTYSGCPAMQAIEDAIVSELRLAGFDQVAVQRRYKPAWTTDWMTPEARQKLETDGIAPPPGSETEMFADVRCPQCASDATDVISPFGSTACKALMVCSACGEPFHHFKAI